MIRSWLRQREFAKKKASRIKQYEMLREGHHHEWTILTIRITAYLTSQSLFASGAAVIYANLDRNPSLKPAVLFLAGIGLALTILSSISISINLRILRDWHKLITNLLTVDEEPSGGELGGLLKGHYLPRKQPDGLHTLSVDFYCGLVTVIGGIAWVATIANILKCYRAAGDVEFTVIVEILVLIALMSWMLLIALIYLKWSRLKQGSLIAGSQRSGSLS